MGASSGVKPRRPGQQAQVGSAQGASNSAGRAIEPRNRCHQTAEGGMPGVPSLSTLGEGCYRRGSAGHMHPPDSPGSENMAR